MTTFFEMKFFFRSIRKKPIHVTSFCCCPHTGIPNNLGLKTSVSDNISFVFCIDM